MKNLKLLLPLLPLAALLSGCTTMSKDTVGFERAMLENSAKANEKASLANYRKYIADNQLRPFADYNTQLDRELKDIRSSDIGVLNPPSLYGIPFFYQQQLGELVDAHIAAATLCSKQKQYKQGLDELDAALSLVREKAVSRYFQSVRSADIYRAMQKLFKEQGENGKALSAGFNADMLDDYRGSQQGVADYCMEKDLAVTGRELSVQLSLEVNVINWKRDRAAAQQFISVLQTVSQISSSLQQAGVLQGSSGLNNPTQMMKVMLAAGEAAQSKQGAAGVLAAIGNATISEQLVNPKMSYNTSGIIRSFASAASTLSANPDIKKRADELMDMADSLNDLRKGTGGKDAVEKMQKFAKSLTSFQEKVEQLH